MSKSPIEKFTNESVDRSLSYKQNNYLQDTSKKLIDKLALEKYTYNFFWLGVPVIQYPQDIQAFQEIIWQVKPDLIIETGVAWGGSIIFSASMLAILESCNYIENGLIVGIDIDIRSHNKKAILDHPLNKKIKLFEGSSIDDEIISKIKDLAKNKKRVLVMLDSNHTHDHVLEELKKYTPFVTEGSYCIVADTLIEDLSEESIGDRPWGKGNNPKTAVWEFLENNKDFELDSVMESKLVFTSCSNGFLKRVK